MSDKPRPWTVLDQQDCLSAPPWLTVRRQTVRLPSGRLLTDFYEVALPDSAVIAALTTDGQFVLAREYKHAVRGVTVTLPAGLLEPDEPALQGAKRELREETGYVSDDWRLLSKFVLDANRHCGVMHVFLARDCRLEGAPTLDEAEEIIVELMAPARLRQALRDGELNTVAGAAGAALALALMEES